MKELLWRTMTVYRSHGDEDAFFNWLGAVDGVLDVRGAGTTLHIRLADDAPSESAARELIALYRRYDGDVAELETLVTPENAVWLRPMLECARR